MTLTERFWSKVDQSAGPNACWPWLKEVNNKGYGRFWIYGNGSERSVQAHRFAVELATGGPITLGLIILHSCDNPPCCNPAHLRIGTYSENTADAIAKGRLRPLPYEKQQRGSARPAAVLTEDDIPEIRERLRRGDKQRDIAASFGVSQKIITLINLRRAWTHVPDPGALETPVRVRELQPCGTSAAYQRHQKLGEDCRACKNARAAYERDRKARRQNSACVPSVTERAA